MVTPVCAMVERATRVLEVRMREQTEEAGMVVLGVGAMVASDQVEPERQGVTS